MKTRDRILHTSLALFNEFGEPNVTTLQIADELDISPGNLYYHFKNKTEIVNELFGWFETEIKECLLLPEVSIDVEDQWLFIHLIFETIARFNFIYQDLVNILVRYKHLETRFKRILEKKRTTTFEIFDALSKEGLLVASGMEIHALCENIVMMFCYWLSYSSIRATKEDSTQMNEGVYQVMSLVAPYLVEQGREMIEALSKVYLEK
jgi:AcrR family transcriptional regulator